MIRTPAIGLMGRRIGVLLVGASLLAGCFPVREYGGMPDASVIAVDADGAHPPDCRDLDSRSPMVGESGRPVVAFGCATYTNLSAMVAEPTDLVAPKAWGGVDGSQAEGAVKRYRDGKPKALRKTTTSSQFDSSSGASAQ